MSIKRDIEYAIYIHGTWKTRFRDFLNGRSPMDLSAVGRTDACKLGHWLDDDARRMLSPEDHAEVCRLHAHFHEIAGGIVQDIKQKDFARAREALVSGGRFDQASHSLGAFLRRVALRGRHTAGGPKPNEGSGTNEATAADEGDTQGEARAAA